MRYFLFVLKFLRNIDFFQITNFRETVRKVCKRKLCL